ncbi:unnamed protein product, partial [Porites evermanni]
PRTKQTVVSLLDHFRAPAPKGLSRSLPVLKCNTLVVETSVTVNKNSAIQDYVHPYDETQPTFEYFHNKVSFYEVTETWLSEIDDAYRAEITPPGYKLFDHTRSDRSGGGTALLIRENLHASRVDGGVRTSFEFSH